jgi:UDPglucose--hexose-1-phosphate uridylyltransferase
MVATRPVAKTSTSLADGRSLIYFDDRLSPGHRELDTRDLAESSIDPELRFDPLQEEWVIVASHRQERTHLPPLDECPLCPSTPGHATEIPAADYDVVVFENRFPSLTPTPEITSYGGLLGVAGGVGQCEVICFSSDHETSFSYLSDERLSTIADSMVDRTQVLSQIPGVEYVLVFENRGSDVGVTLHHPHGQIYAYPFIPPKPKRSLDAAARYWDEYDKCLFCAVLEAELEDGRRIVAGTANFVAYVPSAARWPYEIHIQPRKHVADLADLSREERGELLRLQADVTAAFDGLFAEPMPYLSTVFQAPVHKMRDLAHLRIEVVSPRRAPGKLKYLASSESAAGAFINDIVPERAAAHLRASWPAGPNGDSTHG